MSSPADDPFRGSYRDVVTHKLMLQDVLRTSAYADAIRAVVGTGSQVIDFGTGTGILAIFAVRAGAARVYAIERTAIVEQAKAIARLNGHDAIEFHHGSQSDFVAEGPVDVIVSEWMGHFLFFESMLEPLIALRERWLKPDGIMLPSSFSLHAALVVDESLHEDDAFLECQPYGVDFGPIADLPLRQCRLIDIEERQVLLPPIDLGCIDMKRVTSTPRCLEGRCVVDSPITAYGMVGWFDACLTRDIEFGTGPSHPATHWRPLYFPFPEPFDCRPNRSIAITIWPPDGSETAEATWAWKIDDGDVEQFVDEKASMARVDGVRNQLEQRESSPASSRRLGSCRDR